LSCAPRGCTFCLDFSSTQLHERLCHRCDTVP
jgi:hypothetical protein